MRKIRNGKIQNVGSKEGGKKEGWKGRWRIPQRGVFVERKPIRPEASSLKVCIGTRRNERFSRTEVIDATVVNCP